MEGKVNLGFITDPVIDKVLELEDLDDAVGRLMMLAGITDGGIASLAFSEYVDEYAAWASASPQMRRFMIKEWLKLEQTYLDREVDHA